MGNKNQNKMRKIEIEKIILNCGGTDEKLEKSVKLLEKLTQKKIKKIKSTKRIPGFKISPGKFSGCKITIRNKKQIIDLLNKFFVTIENEISNKKITLNAVSFGISECIEIPGFEYDRQIGILGFEISIIFKRKGKRVKLKKNKRGKYPLKQQISKLEIIEYLKENFGLEVI